MKIQIFDKAGSVKNDPIYLSYLVLKQFKKQRKDKISIFKLVSIIKHVESNCDAKQFVFSLMLLKSMNIIYFEEPYIGINNA